MAMSDTTKNIFSLSAGKDSTATLLVGIAQEVPNLHAVSADTGYESPLSYEYLDYLEDALGIRIQRVKADFSTQIARKRRYIEERWPKEGVSDEAIKLALEMLHPTGIPFLDLCLWKGRFPSTKARFCTHELKVKPLFEQCLMPALDGGGMVLSWQGVRRDESLARRYLPECDEVGGGLYNYRPILKWKVEDVFEAHRYMGIRWNPLYEKGCGRVGCFPCINETKDGIANISQRWPWVIDLIEKWERMVSLVSKRGCSTFYCAVDDPMFEGGEIISPETHGIRKRVEWAKTSRGGRQYDLIKSISDTGCKSAYGLCDSA